MSDIDDELFALAGGDDEGDVEEGEASSPAASSHNSLGSDAMEESDSERDDGPDDHTDVPYPLEGRYIDEADKRRINQMSQLDREAILGQRAEEMSHANFTAELRRVTNDRDRKRKVDDADDDDMDLDDDAPPKAKPRTNDKLEAYKREREQRGQQRQRVDDRRHGRRSSSGERSHASDRDAEGDSEGEAYDDRRNQETVHEEQPAGIRDFDAVRVGRGFFAEYCFFPGFDEAVTGTFTRIGTGIDSQRRTLYKMAQIKGFTTGKPYVFEGDDKRVATDQYVIAQYGSAKKEFAFHFCSNQSFTDADFDSYKQSLQEIRAKIPTPTSLKRKDDDLKQLKNHHWSEEDINERIAKQKKYAHLLNRSNDSAQPRIATQSETAAQRTAELNRKNRILEAERVRKVQLEQQRQKKIEQKQQAARVRAEAEARKAQEENNDFDALFDGDGSSRASTPKPQEKKTTTTTERKGLPTFRKPKMDDDIIANMDLGIDIDI